jgi:hypothetical protein
VRILVDSSAWIESLNGSASPVAEEVDRLLGSRRSAAERLTDHHGMRRLEIEIDEELDEALEAAALHTGHSKAELICRCIESRLRPLRSGVGDPFEPLIGSIDAEPRNIDEGIYGR